MREHYVALRKHLALKIVKLRLGYETHHGNPQSKDFYSMLFIVNSSRFLWVFLATDKNVIHKFH